MYESLAWDAYLKVTSDDDKVNAVPAVKSSGFLNRRVDVVETAMALEIVSPCMNPDFGALKQEMTLTHPSTATLTEGESGFDASML